MADEKMMRLSQVARKLNVGLSTIVEFLGEKGHEVESSPNAKINGEQFAMLSREFADSASEKEEASGLSIGTKHADIAIDEDHLKPVKKTTDEEVLIKNLSAEKVAPQAKEETKPEKVEAEKTKLQGIKVLGKIDLDKKKEEESEEKADDKVEALEEEGVEHKAEVEEKTEEKVEVPKEEKVEDTVSKKEEEPKAEEKEDDKLIEAKADKLQGLKVVGKIDLPTPKDKKSKPVASSDDRKQEKKKRPRKRMDTRPDNRRSGQPNKPRVEKEEPSEKEIQDKIKATLAKLSGGKKKGGAKYRREKRSAVADAKEEQMLQEQEESKTLKVTEFISANDLASLMNVSVNDVISVCMGLGMFVSINHISYS